MTRYELISAIAKKAGVSNIEATALFEIFLLKLSEKVSVNHVVSLDGVGFFNPRKGVNKRQQIMAGSADVEIEELDLIIFSEKLEEISDQKKNHTFILPKSGDEKYNEIDSHFSLSINKPSEKPPADQSVTGQKDSFQNLYGKELKKYLNNKAEQIVNHAKSVEHVFDDRKVISDDLPKDVDKGFSIISQDKVQDIARELGKDISPEVTEENPGTKNKKTIQIEKNKQRLESLPWNFGSKFPVKKVDDQEEEKPELPHLDPVPRDQLYERKPEPFRVGKPKVSESDDKTKEEEAVSKEELESEISEIIGSYQRVKPILNDEDEEETPQVIEKKENKSDERPKPSPTLLKSEPTGFHEVKSKSESLQLKDQINTQKREWKRETKRKEREKADSEEFYPRKPRKKNKLTSVFAVLFTIILAAGALYLYVEQDSIFGENPNNRIVSITKPPGLSSDDRSINITTEYPNEGQSKEEGISGEESNTDEKQERDIGEKKDDGSGIEINTEPIKTVSVTVKKEDKPVVKEVVAPPPPVKKEESIVKSGEYFNILMGTFNSEATAESEAEKYNDMGYNAFVQSTLVPGQGIKFKVRVGDFTSEENARKFKNLHGK